MRSASGRRQKAGSASDGPVVVIGSPCSGCGWRSPSAYQSTLPRSTRRGRVTGPPYARGDDRHRTGAEHREHRVGAAGRRPRRRRGDRRPVGRAPSWPPTTGWRWWRPRPRRATQATGRSAAVFIDGYGGSAITPFTAASRAWFATGGGFADHELLTPRGMLVVAAPGDDGPWGRAPAGWPAPASRCRWARRWRCSPRLRPERVAARPPRPRRRRPRRGRGRRRLPPGVPGSGRHAGLRHPPPAGFTRGRLAAPGPAGGPWRVATSAGDWEAEVIVDAAGAWADEVAAACGVGRVGLRPLRRTACTFRPARGRRPPGVAAGRPTPATAGT